MRVTATFIAGAVTAVAYQAALPRLLRAKFSRDLAALNAGDFGPLLSGYADDAQLVFAEGDHRWAETHTGKAAIERFLCDFVAAGLQGELSTLLVGGPPWALEIAARFDDRASGPDGEEIYANRVVLLLRTRWGKVVHHEDFYEDTERIGRFDRRLTELGIRPGSVESEPPGSSSEFGTPRVVAQSPGRQL